MAETFVVSTGTQNYRKTAARLERLGLRTAAADVAFMAALKNKVAIAMEHYRFVRRERITEFNAALLAKTGKNMHSIMDMEYQRLDFVSLGDYGKVPPEDVLVALETAQGRKCFDTFSIAYIKNVKDPLLFGHVTGCPHSFYIAGWDDDIKIEDLLKDNEG